MVNRPRIKGTGAESDFVNWLHADGYLGVERHALHGNHDIGDIDGIPGLAISVKFVGKGKPMDLSGWLNELQTMRENVRRRQARYLDDYGSLAVLPDGVLVVRRAQYPDVGDWYAIETWRSWWERYKSSAGL